jgi:hypothetical protein
VHLLKSFYRGARAQLTRAPNICERYDTLQLHVAPQRHASPHAQPAFCPLGGFWQPHLHWDPAQAPQTQTFELFDM